MTTPEQPERPQQTDQPQHPEQESFAVHVERLVTEGKLTRAEAAELLEPVHDEAARQADALALAHEAIRLETVRPDAVDLEKGAASDTPPDLTLDVSGYGLQVVQDASLTQPRLTASRGGVLQLRAGPDGWTLRHVGHERAWGLKAVLSLPFMPRSVRAEVSGGNLTLPDISGAARIEVSGGNATLGGAAELQAEVSGGNLTAGVVSGALRLEVSGGNMSVAHSSALHAEINGGQLTWAGRLDAGQHTLEVNGGQATLRLSEGSSVQIQAESTLGGVSSSFPLQKTGGVMRAQYSGTLGGGAASLKCEVNAGQIRLVAEGADGGRS